jgi:hypothetical protein
MTQGAGTILNQSAGSPTPITTDMVNHPPHYTSGGIETIDYIKAKMSPDEYIGYLRGNILKYTSRIGLKGDPVEDSGKIVWYAVELNKYITQIKK